MEIAPFAQEELASRALSDISITSNTSAKAQNLPSFEATYHARDKRVKLMCSYGGKILPRPSDRKLRYVGGETRMVSVSRHIHFVAFLQKLTEIYGPDLAVKYQLPEEDLDALVSVSSDEDLENMMDECDRLDALEGASRLRVFVFSSIDIVALDLNDIVDPKVSELRYVDAVNAVQVEASLIKNGSFGLTGPYNSSDGHLAYGSQIQERVLAHPENSQPSGRTFGLTISSSNDVPDIATSPLPVISIKQERAPLEFVSIKGPDRNAYYGAVVAGDDFRDLESGESPYSSASSQHDLYSRYSSNHWAPRSQRQSHTEPFPYGSPLQDSLPHGNAEDELKKTEQLLIKDVQNKKGARDSKVSAKGMSVLPPERPPDAFDQFYDVDSADAARKPGTNLHRDVPLSPGAMLQKQLQADQDSSKVNAAESLQPFLNGDGMQLPQHLHEQRQSGRFPLPFLDHATALIDATLDADHTISKFLHTQVFEPGDIHQPPERTSNLVLPDNSGVSVIATGQIDEGGIPGSILQEAKLHESSMDLPAGFSPRDFTGSLYNEDGRERSEISMFASQSFSQEPYNTVFQTCSSEIFPSSMDDVDDLLQQVLSPMTNSTDQRSMHDYHYGLTSQAPWLAPDSISFPLSSQGNSSMLDSHSHLQKIPGNAVTQPLGTPRTQNYDGRLYSPGLMLFGESLQQVVNNASSEAKSLEELSTQDKVSKVLPSSQSTPNPMRSDMVSSLGSLGELNVEHKDLGVELSYASVGKSELLIDGNSRDKKLGSHQPSIEPALQQESEAYSHEIGGETEPNTEKMGDEESCSTSGFLPPFTAAPSVLETWSTTSQSEHEPQSVLRQPFDQDKDLVEIELSGPVENETTIEDPKSEIEDIDTFQSADDRSMSPASAAEVEAIARGLQIIRHFDLEELRELGSGTFGTVYHGKWRGTDVAIKRIKSSCFMGRPSERERLIADFWREAYILGQLHHPNVVAFYGVVPDGPGGTLATLTEYMVNGSLKQALQKKDRALDRRKRLLIAMDAAFGMEYLHGKNVVHFDLKCENLLVNLRDLQRPICKVGDLGLSKVKQQTLVSGGVRGTLPWMAPELLNGSSSLVSEKVDVFSFGIVLWELLTGEEPYATMHYGAIIGGIVSNTLRPPVPKWCDSAWKSLMERCWSADPAKRPTFPEIARSLRAMEATLNAKGQGQAPTVG